MKTIRLSLMVLLVLLPTLAFATGQTEGEATAEADVYTVRYMVPGNEPEDSALVDEELNKMMQDDGLSLALERVWVPWDAWDQKVNIALSTGEPYDLIATFDNNVGRLATTGGLVALDEYLTEENADVLLDTIPENAWQHRAVNGKVYAFPVYYRDFAFFNDVVTVQSQRFEEYGYSVEELPRNWEELTPILDEIISAELEKGNDLRFVLKRNMFYQMQMERMNDSFPYDVTSDGIAILHMDGSIESYIESDEFRNIARLFRDWYVRGISHPDFLVLPHEQVTNRGETGQWLFATGLAGNRDRIRESVPDAEFFEFRIYPNQPMFRGPKLVRNLNSVPTSSERPEAAVRFFNWLYSSQAQYDLFHYGIEGAHWERAGAREWVQLARDRYDWGDWRTGHVDLVRVPSGTEGTMRKFHLTFSEEAIDSAAVGFNFDPEPVSAEYGAVTAEFQGSVWPVMYGVADFDSRYDRMVESMKAAGLDAVMSEYERQFREWSEANK